MGGLAAEADVLSLAAQLGGSGGTELADQLVADPVDPKEFMAGGCRGACESLVECSGADVLWSLTVWPMAPIAE